MTFQQQAKNKPKPQPKIPQQQLKTQGKEGQTKNGVSQ